VIGNYSNNINDSDYYTDSIDWDSLTPSLIDKVKPNNRKDTLKKAREYVWTTALLYAIIKMKCDFASAGLRVVSENDKVHDYFNKLYFEKLDIQKYVRNANFEYFTAGEFTPHFNFNGSEPNYITIFNPELVNVKSAMGKDFIFLKPSNDVQVLLNTEDKKIEKELRKIIPKEFIKKWKRGKEVHIENAKRYLNLKAYHEKEPHSPIEPIFSELEILRNLKEADFATAKKLKQLFLHVKVGSEKLNNGKPVDKDIMEGVKDLFNDPYKSAELITQYFVDLDYKIPDLKIFSNEKYQGVIIHILWWAGCQMFFSDGDSYSKGVIKLKPLKQEVKNARKEIKKSLDEFNRKVSERQGFTYYGKTIVPRVHFNESALDDEKQINDMLKFLYNTGTLSIEELHEKSGYDFKFQMDKKEEEKKYEDNVYLHYESSQGMGGVNKDGGENDEGDENNTQQPRPNS
jgi:hypothetical protein